MLVGPGGVIALVICAWGILWAVRAVPGTPWRGWLPGAMAFITAAYASALLTCNASLVIATTGWIRAEATERAELLSSTAALFWRPLAGASAGSLAIVLVLLVLTRSPTTQPPRQSRVELPLVTLAVLCVLAGLGNLGLLFELFTQTTSSMNTALRAGPLMLPSMALGTALALVGLTSSAGVGLAITRRSTQ